MVLLRDTDLVNVYKGLRGRWVSSGKASVQVLVGSDLDGVCALKIMMQLFLSDKVEPTVTPVDGLEAIKSTLQDIPSGEVSIIFLNCGGGYPLDDYIPSGDVEAHVIDSHRPIRYENITSKNIQVWQGETEDIGKHIKRSQRNKHKRRKTVKDADDEDSLSSESSEEDDEDAYFTQRYYRGNWFGQPTATLLYRVTADAMAHHVDDVLWFAAVSLVHFLLTKKISKPQYESLISSYLLTIAQKNVLKPQHERLGKDNIEYKAFHTIRLEEALEHQLYLLRLSSLWDSLYYSPYVSSKMKLLDSDGGINKLKRLLHGKLGLKEEDTKIEWSTLWGKEEREDLLSMLTENFRTTGMSAFSFKSIIMQQGYSIPISASDMGHICNAVLNDPGKDWTSMFWAAYDVLDNRRSSGRLDEASSMAKASQAALISQTAFLLQTGYIRNVGHFRYCFVNESSSDLAYFSRPASLLALARCILDVLIEGEKTPSPLVMLSLNKDQGTYCVVPCMPLDGSNAEDEYNPFGTHLRAAVASLNMQGVAVNSLDHTSITIPKREARTLIDSLSLRLHQKGRV
eukprot:TRINITY_DN13243_c0_g1_i1.p1 TRINITY_DN13243_c0_g1~~TRINITY_DN13243_c0_g1_i1.p1  ORF type:complete len:569 (+),score=147.96 TRINITY_DN13243_c0_g1_i1:198-1904(+)